MRPLEARPGGRVGACWLHLPSALPNRDVGPIQLVATSRPSGFARA